MSDETNAKVHPNLLTEEEWARATVPFYYMQVNFKEWDRLEFEIALKFILGKATGWVYYSDKRFIFEKADDYVLFKLWAEDRPMVDTHELEIT